MRKNEQNNRKNKVRVVIKRLLQEFNLYCKFIYIGKNNDKNKTILPAPQHPHLPLQLQFNCLNY